jgi:cbb3-type cytochrome oxidase subunit 1
MHHIVRRFIKTGIAFLVLGLLLGLWMLIRRELFGAWASPYLVAAHTHVLLVGFVMFMILGVAAWLFPRPTPADTRYQPPVVESSYWILLLGTVGRFAGEVLRSWVAARWVAWVVVAGGAAQVVGIGLFMWTMWTRIRSVGSRAREERGERF